MLLATRQTDAFQRTRQVTTAEKMSEDVVGNASERGNVNEAPDDLTPNGVHVSIEIEKKTISESDVNATIEQSSSAARDLALRAQLRMDTITEDVLVSARRVIDQTKMEALSISSVSADSMRLAVTNAGPRGLYNLRETFDYPTSTFHETKEYGENQTQQINASLAQRLSAIATNATVTMQQLVSQHRHFANAALERLMQKQVLDTNSSLRIKLQKALDSGGDMEVLWQKANGTNLTAARAAEHIVQIFSTAVRRPIQAIIDDARNKSLNGSMAVRELSAIVDQAIASDLDPLQDVVVELSAVQETLRDAIHLSKSLKAAALATEEAQMAALVARQRAMQAEADLHEMLNKSMEEDLDAVDIMAHEGSHEELRHRSAAEIAQLAIKEEALFDNFTAKSSSRAQAEYLIAQSTASKLADIIDYAATGVNSTATAVNRGMVFFRALNLTPPD